MNHVFFFAGLVLYGLNAKAQNQRDLILPDSSGWNVLNENQSIIFQVKTNAVEAPTHYSIEGAEELGIQFDTLGNFKWKPSFDLVDRVTKTKDFSVIFQATWKDGKRNRKPVTFTINHVNRPPVIEELPIFYVKQSTQNSYQLSADYVYDPDGDPHRL